MTEINRSVAVAALLIAILALGTLGLGGKSYWASHMESRRALIARNMVETGDYVIPQANGKKTLTKPPLYYWAVAASYKITGKASEWSARIPSVLFGFGVLFLTFLIGRAVYDSFTGMASAAVLSTSYLFVHYMRLAELDMMFVFFITLSLFFLLPIAAGFLSDGEEPDTKLWALGFWISAALGFMVKGPFALMFPLGAILALIPFSPPGGEGKLISLKRIFPPKGIIVFLLIAIPWFVYAFFVADGWSVFSEETLQRVTSSRGKPRNFFYYVSSLVNFSPWLLMLPLALYGAFTREIRRSAFILSWLLAGIVIATLISAKAIHYILPLYPAAALLVGRCIALYVAGEEGGKDYFDMAVGFIGFFLLIFCAGAFAALPLASLFSNIVPSISPILNLPIIVLLMATTALAYRDLVADRREALWQKAIASLFVLFIFTNAVAIPQLNSRNSHKQFLVEAKPKISKEYGAIMYRLDNFQVPFYLGRVVPDLRDEKSIERNHEKMKAENQKYLIIARLSDSKRLLDMVGGEIVMRDSQFVAVSESKEGERLVLIEASFEQALEAVEEEVTQ